MSPTFQIETDHKNYKLILFGQNLLYLAYMDDAEVDLSKIKEIKQKGLEMVNRRPFFSVVNLRNVFGIMTNEAREFIATDEELNRLKIVEYVCVNSLAIKLLVKGYLSFNKPITDTIVIKKLQELKEDLLKRELSYIDWECFEEYLNSLEPREKVLV